MLQLLQPLWLFALTGISIPVIIHFWNQRPGRTLKVGSISLIEEDSKEYKRSLKLSDLLLLLLRCLLIGALAIVLSNPVWRKPSDNNKQKGWILINKQNIPEAYSHFKPLIDSLNKAGFGFHYFEEGFQKEKLEDALAKQNDSVSSKPLSYWSTASLLDAENPGTFPVYIFTDNYIKHFSGTRPTLSFHPNWFTYTASDTSRLLKPKAGIDTTTLNISIFSEKYPDDARYLKAAIDAIQSFSKRNIKLSVVKNSKDIPSQQDWLFWLSDLPAQQNSDAKNIFLYEQGKTKSISSVIIINNLPLASPPLLYKLNETNDSTRSRVEDIWTTSFGNAVLSFEKKSNTAYYHFYSHFDPAWNELVWNNNFPAMIYTLLRHEKTKSITTDASDKRIIDAKQLLPVFTQDDNQQKEKKNLYAIVNLTDAFWLIVLLLFFTERFFSFQNNKPKKNG